MAEIFHMLKNTGSFFSGVSLSRPSVLITIFLRFLFNPNHSFLASCIWLYWQNQSNENNTVWTQKQTHGSVEQNSESPEISPCTNGQLTYDKVTRDIQWGKNNLFNNWCWENWTATCKRMKLEYPLTLYTKINSKWIKDLDVRPNTVSILEENIGRTLSDINHSSFFWFHLTKQRK